jgi:hypothetical protein
MDAVAEEAAGDAIAHDWTEEAGTEVGLSRGALDVKMAEPG